ncbi:MAG: redoxin domain-containing protein [Phycisphaerales bacterium]|nr:redoxin domain-containing protein [Phycisphaerales bacterium]
MYGRAIIAAAVAALGAAAFAGDEQPQLKLTIGDKAPAVDISNWVKGDKVAAWDPDKIYVLEFWATWCGPCKASMPHISEMQAKYRDYGVTFIGVSDEPMEKVGPFLADPAWDAKTKYTMATDPDRSTHKAYMEAALQRGIPTAFVIGKGGTIEWIGHPMTLDEPMEKIVKGTWDSRAFKQTFENDIKVEMEMSKRNAALRQAIKDGDWSTVMKNYDELIRIAPDNPQFKIAKFETMLSKMNDPAAAYRYGNEILAAHRDNAMVMNQLAWFVVDDAGVTSRDLKFARQAAEQANEITKGEDAAILDTLARVLFDSGEVAKAIEVQTKAAKLAPDGPMGDSIKETLKRYQEKAGH